MKLYRHLVSSLIYISCGALHFAADASVNSNEADFIDFTMLKETQLDMKQLPPKYPEGLSDLNNKQVTIVGFMAPVDQVKNINHFLLMPQAQGCFFCDTPMTLLDMAYVKLSKDQTTSISDGAVKVTGTLKLLSGATPLNKREGGLSGQMVFTLDNATITNANQDEIKQYTLAAKKH